MPLTISVRTKLGLSKLLAHVVYSQVHSHIRYLYEKA